MRARLQQSRAHAHTRPAPPLRRSLAAHFSVVGPVAGVKIGRRGNFGFVSFHSEAHASSALSLHGSSVAGAEINVEKANPPAPRGARRPRAPRDAPAA